MTPITGGTDTIRGWYHALITWALVAAVAAVIVFAGMWALGNIRSTPQTASRGKWGVLVAIVACMLLGGSQVYLQTLYDKWAPGFQPNPASYAVDDAPQADRFRVLDLSDKWNAKITEYRAADGWTEQLLTSPDLVALATDCAKALAGAPGTQCNTEDPFWRSSYNSAELAKLSGLPTKDQVQFLVTRIPDPNFVVRRAAWVAVEDENTKHAKLVALFSSGDCDGNGTCHGIVTLKNLPVGNEDIPDQPQIGGG